MNRERLSAVLADRENVIAQENLEIAFFGEFRDIIRAIARNRRIFSRKGYGKHALLSGNAYIMHKFPRKAADQWTNLI